MAGGTANKAHGLLVTALAKIRAAQTEIQVLQQAGNPVLHGKHADALTAINEAITALTALT